MGAFFPFPFAKCSDLVNSLESVTVKSISFGDDEVKTPVRSISFNGQDPEPTILKSLGSGKMILEGSVSFKGCELEKMLSGKFASSDKEESCLNTAISPRSDGSMGQGLIHQMPILDPKNPKHEAAVKLQKVYKSFRTRRKLADCAVLIEQSWWKLLDFAELKRSSISFFEIEKHESAISRWSRARTRAAKVGKGLSKNDKAQKLALQHWLEAIDPRHRYGHNLHFYYDKWLHSQSKEPFFYWLDIGEGKEVSLVEKCPRWKLQQQCIKYLGPMERKAYEVVVKDGKLLFQQTGQPLHTTGDAKWIFVLSTSKNMYVSEKKKGKFQHSSFLAGGATIAAGRIVVEGGILKAVWPHSGHYRPTEENFKDFISFLKENNVDLTDVKMSPVDEEEVLYGKQKSSHSRCNSSEEDLAETLNCLDSEVINGAEELTQEKADSVEPETTSELERPKSMRFQNLSKKLTDLEIPKRSELFERLESDDLVLGESFNDSSVDSLVEDGYETAEEALASEEESEVAKQETADEEHEGNAEEHIPEESILQRINSKKGMNSFQLGKQLSSKWTTGAGPRIGCVRDYPSELQLRALEQVNLSPRSAGLSKLDFCSRSNSCLSPNVSTPTISSEEMTANLSSSSLKKGNFLQRSIHYITHSSPLLKGALTASIANPS